MKKLLFILLFLLQFAASAKSQTNEMSNIFSQSRNYISNDMHHDTIPSISLIKYDSVRKFHNGLAAVKKNNAWGFINKNGEEVIAVEYDKVNDFIESATKVLKNGDWLVIKSNGKILGKLVDSSRELATPSALNSINLRSGSTLSYAAAAVCPPNLDFELGNFSNWNCFAGNTTSSGTTNIITVTPSAPISDRHNVYTSTIPSFFDFYGGFPVNPPGGSNHALKLGNDEVGGFAERVRYRIDVPLNDPDYSLTFQYAVVMENPDASSGGVEHDDWQQPRFTAKLFDAITGENIPCASFTYVASLVPGFLNSPILGNGGARIKYKPWSKVYVNLTKYQGRPLYLEFTTADCTLGGHFGYAYVDVVECGIGAQVGRNCTPPNITTLKSPDGFQTYKWYDNNFTTLLGTTQNLTLNPGPAINSIFKVIVKPFNNTDCSSCDCSDTLSVKITADYPLANAGINKTICGPGGPANLGVAALPGHTYSWSPTTFLSNPNISNPVTTTPVSAIYILTVTTDSSGCSASDTVVVNVYPKPTASFTAVPNQCLEGNNFIFNNNSTITGGGLSYLWTFGDGSTSTATSPSHAYINPGIYNVKLVVTGSFGCKDSLSQSVQIYPKPIVNWNTSATQCLIGNVFNFTNSSSILSGTLNYFWSFGDGNNSVSTNPSHTYSNVGTYNVKLIVTSSDGCKDSLIRQVTVNPNPVAAFTVGPNQCLEGNNFVFNNTSTITSGGLSYLWTFGDGSVSTATSPSHSYVTPAIYNVKLVVTGSSGCKDSLSQSVQVYPKPNVNWNTSATQCLNGNVFNFTNSSTILSGTLSYFWSFGDGSNSVSTNPSHSYSNVGTYNVKLIAIGSDGCKDSLLRQVTVNPNPVAAFAVGGSQCLKGNNFAFSNNSTATGILSSFWTFGDGGTSTSTNPTYSYATPGIYVVKLIVTSNTGCQDSIIKTVTVHPSPNVRFTVNDLSQCLTNNNFIFSNASSVLTGNINNFWSFGDGITSTAINPSYFYTTTGNFIVKLVVTSDKFCKDSLSIPVVLRANPVVDVTVNNDITLCLGNSVNLGATGGVSYNWSPVNGLNCSTCPNPLSTPLNNTTYVVSGTAPNGCVDYDTIKITVIKPFVMSAIGDTICIRDTASLMATGATTYRWSPAVGLNSITIANPIAFPTVTTQYRVVGYDGYNCFTDTSFVTVAVGKYPTVQLGPDLLLSTGTILPLTSTVTEGPVRNWLWTPSTELDCNICPIPLATIKKDITYAVNITNIYGCNATDTINIKAFCENTQVFVPNVFTPDGDGINDVLMVRGKGIVTVKYFRIFNRWGELIFERSDFPPNVASYGWDGKIRGVKGPPDVFVYIAEVICENGTPFFYKGNTSIIK